MAASSITGSVRSTRLEAELGKTIMGRFIPQIDDYLRKSFKQKGNNIEIPTLGYLFKNIEGMKQPFIDLYNSRMGLEKGVDLIPDDLKASQGALLDGLCFGYDLESEDYALYTMNFELLSVIDNDLAQRPKQCITANKKALLKSYRVDIEYLNSPESFNFKMVNHRKSIDDDTQVLLIPYLVVLRLMLMIESFLSGNMILKTRQNLHGAEKVRVITKNQRVLAEFCDDPNAPLAVSPMFFPLRGFFYAPVVGAPSTTAMVTNIDLFRLDEIKRISDVSGIKRLGIEKPESPIMSLVGEQVICSTLMSIKADSPERFKRIVQSLPKASEVLGNDESAYTNYNISKYLHTINGEEFKAVISAIPGVRKEVSFRSKMFKNPTPATPEQKANLRGLLKEHVVKFILKKKDCKLSSITCTNSDIILRGIYGRDYFAKYEGFNVRFYAFLNALKSDNDIENLLLEYGFLNDTEIIKKIDEITKAGAVTEMSFEEALKQAIAENEGVKLKSPSKDSDNITVRLLNAYINQETGKVEDYYRSIDPHAIVDVTILS